MATSRKRALNISLGVEGYDEYKQALDNLANDLNLESTSHLIQHLARAYIAEPGIAKLIDAAFAISGGADWDETIEFL